MNQFQKYAHNNKNAYDMHIIYHCIHTSLSMHKHRLYFDVSWKFNTQRMKVPFYVNMFKKETTHTCC